MSDETKCPRCGYWIGAWSRQLAEQAAAHAIIEQAAAERAKSMQAEINLLRAAIATPEVYVGVVTETLERERDEAIANAEAMDRNCRKVHREDKAEINRLRDVIIQRDARIAELESMGKPHITLGGACPCCGQPEGQSCTCMATYSTLKAEIERLRYALLVALDATAVTLGDDHELVAKIREQAAAAKEK